MADDCCNVFGGRIEIEADGKIYAARGDITIQPTNLEVSADANHDGSMFTTARPKLYGAEATFTDPCDLRWSDAMAKCAINVSIYEVEKGRMHLFTKARFIGRPAVNLSTGEVTGVSIAGSSYRVV